MNLAIGIGIGIGIGRPATFDLDTLNWQQRVIAAGGAVSGENLSAVDQFVRGCKADGIWDELIMINLLATDGLTGLGVPLKVGGGSATHTLTAFGSSDYGLDRGLECDGSTKYIATGQVPQDSTGGVGVYMGGDFVAPSSRVTLMGISETGAGTVDLYADTDSVNGQYLTSPVATDAEAASFGSYHAVRTGTAVMKLYKDGAEIGSNTDAGVAGDPPTIGLYVFARNTNGTAGQFFPGGARIKAYWHDDGMSAAEALLLYNRMYTFQATLGRA